MYKIVRFSIIIFVLFSFIKITFAQEHLDKDDKASYSLTIQSDSYFAKDIDLGTNRRFFSNNYFNLILRSKHIESGIRYEYLQYPIPGNERLKGNGVANMYFKINYKSLELGGGDLYEQFGTGNLLRAYEDRSIGVDNAIRGAKLVYRPLEDITFKAIAGQERRHFDRGFSFWNDARGYIAASDIETNIAGLIYGKNANMALNLGLSYLYKNEKQESLSKIYNGSIYSLELPTMVHSWASRMQFQNSNWDVFFEYARKTADPTNKNNYIYNDGSLAMLTASYSDTGYSLILGARRSDNFNFISDRNASENDLRINFLQPYTMQHTYAFAAMHPYETQANNEWAYQFDFRYKAKAGSLLGGKKGTKYHIYASYIADIDKKYNNDSWANNINAEEMRGEIAYTSEFFSLGKMLFFEAGFDVEKRFSKDFSLYFSYINRNRNQWILSGKNTGGDIMRSNIFVFDGKYRITNKISLRSELQYHQTKQSDKDWAYGLLEVSILPYFVITLSDEWNVGTSKKHYPMLSLAANMKSNRLQLSIGSTSGGVNCSGGVCRYMPPTSGIFLSYNLNI